MKAPLQSFPQPGARFQSIHVDIVLLPTTLSGIFLFVYLGRSAHPLARSYSNARNHNLLSGYIARFGVPVTIISDQRRQFESDLWRELMNLLGIIRQQATTYTSPSRQWLGRAFPLRCTQSTFGWQRLGKLFPNRACGHSSNLKENYIMHFSRVGVW